MAWGIKRDHGRWAWTKNDTAKKGAKKTRRRDDKKACRQGRQEVRDEAQRE